MRLRGAGWRRTPARLCPLTVVRHLPVSVGGHTLQRTPLASSIRQAAPRGYGGSGSPRRRCSANADRGPVGRRDHQPVPSSRKRADGQAPPSPRPAPHRQVHLHVLQQQHRRPARPLDAHLHATVLLHCRSSAYSSSATLSTSVARTSRARDAGAMRVIYPLPSGVYTTLPPPTSRADPPPTSRCRSLDASGTTTPTRHASPTWATSFNSAHPLSICYKRPIAACIKR